MTAPGRPEAGRDRADTTLRIDARSRSRGVDLTVTAPPGVVTAVLGPNGAGKSTMLSLAAGLLRPDDGSVTVGDRALTSTDRHIHIAPHLRRTALLAQDALLFPHLTALRNVAFAARARGVRRREADAAAHGWLEAVGADDLAERLPRELSGGQSQRVALARALAADPDVLLLDEPFAALDARSAPSMRRVLREVLRDDPRTTVLVTHDLLDAVTLADHVVVIESGRLVESGGAADVLAAPRSAFAATVVGTNSIRGSFTSPTVLTTSGGLQIHGHPVDTPTTGEAGVALIDPRAIAVFVDAPAGSPRNVLPVRIDHVESVGASVRITSVATDRLPAIRADVTLAAATELDLDAGREVHFVVKAGEVGLHPAMSTTTP